MRVHGRGLPVGPVQAAIRPESVLIEVEGHGTGLAGTVVKAAYLGKHLEYTVDSPVGELFVIDRRVEAPRPVGSGVTIRFGDRIALVPAEA